MYFKDKEDTNIDNEFDNESLFSKILSLLNKYKKILIIGLVLVILIVLLIVFSGNNVTNYLVLNGDENITLYQGDDYIELGYEAYNSKDEDLTGDVKITSDLDISEIGEYEITYSLGDLLITRYVSVIEKPKEYTYIYLTPVNNSVDVYLKLGDKYVEPGYKVYNSSGKLLSDQVKVTGEVNTSKKGSYQLVYSLVDSNNVTVSKIRTVNVMDSEISLSLSTKEYTNKDVLINVGVVDEFFDYMVLPNNNKITETSYEYKVSDNGTYKFVVYNKKGISKEASINVNNIDKIGPTGSCKLEYNNNGSVVKVTSSDTSGIKKYVINNQSYTNNVINLSSYLDKADVTIYDKAGNSKTISCKSEALPVITKISKDKTVVTVEVKKVDVDIVGYYFSYNNKMPDENGGYLETNKTSIDVVRLVGTTYVWVKDKSGRVSKPATITLTGDDYPNTSSGYKIIKGTKLRDALVEKGTTLQEFNKLMSRSVRAAGLGTKEGVATAAATLNGTLAYKYGIKIPYWRGGKTNSWGAYTAWGMYRLNPTFENQGYDYYGMDCDGLVNWAYRNGGIQYPHSAYYHWRKSKGLPVSEENGDVGDVMAKEGHVRIIIGKTDKEFIIAEEYGTGVGNIINRHAYTSTNSYTIIKADLIIETIGKDDKSVYDQNMPAF